MKYYCIFAINKSNPEDILGVCENSFSMSYEKGKVCLWQAPNKDASYISIPHKKYFEKQLSKHIDRFQYGVNWGEYINYKGQKRKYRKLVSNHYYKHYHPFGRSNNEYMWNWVKHYAKGILTPPEGYEFFVCRANSKHCPVIVDTSVREGMIKRVLEYKKYDYRNAKFYKKTTTDKTITLGV